VSDEIAERGLVCVFASSLELTITIEQADEGDEIHVHPGGQGFWIARMIDHLGEGVALCAPLGGESGNVIASLIAQSGVALVATHRQDESPVYVHDRRTGERVIVAEQTDPGLSRHETDDLYSRTLETAISSGLIVLTSRYRNAGIPDSFYSRLGSDLSSLDVKVVGDFHGPDLEAFLKEGRLDVLKVSLDDLRGDGLVDATDDRTVAAAISSLRKKGARAIVVSGGEAGKSLVSLEDQWYRVTQPTLQPADFRGSGDSMTAGLAVGLHRGLAPQEMLKLGASAGAANVVRRGLGSADAGLADALGESVQIEEIADPNGA